VVISALAKSDGAFRPQIRHSSSQSEGIGPW
jgi:hypothetical protein